MTTTRMMIWTRGLLVGLVVIVLTAMFASAASAAGPSAWGPPVRLAPTTNDATSFASDVACSSASSCIASQESGNLFTSTAPTGPSVRWGSGQPLADPVTSVACPSSSLCFAGGAGGTVLHSTNPAAGAASWSAVLADPEIGPGGTPPPLDAVSCPTTSFCALISGGDVIASADPTVAGSWSVEQIDDLSSLNPDKTEQPSFLTDISCPTASFCAATDNLGGMYTTTTPLAGAGSWHRVKVRHAFLGRISCASPALCVAAVFSPAANYRIRALVSARPTATASAWDAFTLRASSPTEIGDVSCVSRFCAISDGAGDLFSSTDAAVRRATWIGVNVTNAELGNLDCLSTSFCAATMPDTTSVIAGRPPTAPSIRAALRQPLTPQLGVSALRHRRGYKLTLPAIANGTVRVQTYLPTRLASPGAAVASQRLIGNGQTNLSATARRTITLKLSSHARSILRKHPTTAITRIAFTGLSGPPIAVSRRIRLRH